METSLFLRPYALVVLAVFITAGADFWSVIRFLQSQRMNQAMAVFGRLAHEQVSDHARLKHEVERIAPGSLVVTANLSMHAAQGNLDNLLLGDIPRSLLNCLSSGGRVCTQGNIVAVKLNDPPPTYRVEVATVAQPAWQNLAAFVFETASAMALLFLLMTYAINYFYLKEPLAVIGKLAGRFELREFGAKQAALPSPPSVSVEHTPYKTLGDPTDLWAPADTLVMASHSMSLTKQKLADQKRQHLKWLAYLSHDLSLPLWRVLKRLEALQYDTKLSEDQRLRLLELAQVEIIQSIEVIGSISQFATLENDIEQSFVEVEIRRLLQKTVDVFEFQACNQSIELDLRIGCEVGMARIERSLIRRAIENLITNALRFTPEGGLISVGAQEAGGMVHISIADTGPGIPDGELSHIFDFAFRGEQQPRPSTIGSFGLGLAFVKRVVELHHGTVVARNLKPQGAEFVISIPAGSN